MSHIITTRVYPLAELSDRAREQARDGYRESCFDSDWFGDVYEDFRQVCHILGIDLCQRIVRFSSGRFTEDAEASVSEALRDQARWLYHQLEDEYNRLISAPAVDEVIIANEYTFTASGQRFE